MILLNNHGKPELLCQTLRLSFASHDELIFHLKTLGGNSLHFGFNPGQSYFFLLGSGATIFGFPRVQTYIQSMFFWIGIF